MNAPIAYQIVLKPSVKQPQPHVHFRLMERSRFVIAAGLPFRFSDTNVESGLPKNGESFVSAAVRRLGNGQGQVQRVGVVVSPSVGNPNALTGVTSYTSNGAPPEVGAP